MRGFCIFFITLLLLSSIGAAVPPYVDQPSEKMVLTVNDEIQSVMGRSGQSMNVNTIFSDTFGGSGEGDYVVDVATDASGNHVVTGGYSYDAKIGSSTYGSPNGLSPFIGKVSAFGNWLWVINATDVDSFGYGISIKIDNNGMTYASGCGYDTYKFGAYMLGSPDEYSIFVVKINPQGNLVWAIDAIGYTDCDVNTQEIAIDGNGQVGVVGTMYDSVTPSGWTNPVAPSGYRSAFFGQVNSGGSQWNLFKAIGGDYISSGSSIDLWSGDSSECSSTWNNFLIGGSYENNLVYDSINFTSSRYSETAFVLWLCGDDGSVHYGIGEGQYQGGSTSVIKSWSASSHFASWNRGSAWSYSTSSTNYDSCTGTNNLSSSSQYLFTYDCNYPNNLGFTSYATSPTFSGSGYSTSNTYTLAFSRLLGIEGNNFDNANIQVNYGGSWITVWSNPSSTISDQTWSTQTIDITNYFPGNPYFQIRFGLGTTDSSIAHTGWNIDDVKIEQGGGTADAGDSSVSKVRLVSSSGYESCVAVIGRFSDTLNWHTSTSSSYDVATTTGADEQFSNILCASEEWSSHYSAGIATVSEPNYDIIDAQVNAGAGEISVLGRFSGTRDFDGSSYQSSGCTDLYVATQDANQGSFDSVTVVGGSSCDDASSFDMSSNGNFVLGGWLAGSYTYGSTSFETPDNLPDGFVAAVTSSGTFTWINQVGGEGGLDASFSSTILENGHSVQIGTTTGEFNIGGSAYASSGLQDAVLIMRDPTGAVTKVKQLGTLSYEYGFFIESDSQSNLYIVGLMSCASPPTISDSGGNDVTPSCPSSTTYALYVAKLDINLDPIWARAIGTDWQESRLFMIGDSPIVVVRATVDSEVVVSPSLSHTVGEHGDEWVFTKFNPQTGNPQWMNAIEAVNRGTETEYLSADNDGTNLYVTGNFIGTVQFDSVSTLASSGTDGTADVYIASLSNAGTWQWALAAGGSQDEVAMNIQVADRVYATGTFTDSIVAGTSYIGTTNQGVRPYLLTITTSGSWVDAQQIATTEWDPWGVVALSDDYLAFFGSSEDDIVLTGGLTLSSSVFLYDSAVSAALFDLQSKTFVRGAVLENIVDTSSKSAGVVLDENLNLLYSSYYDGTSVPNALLGGLDDGSTNAYIVSLSLDWDGDGVMNEDDGCIVGVMNWVSDSSTDHDADGCRDADEDKDDDNDGRLDPLDANNPISGEDFCSVGHSNWASSNTTLDYDSDGCYDATEDLDDDNDGVADPADASWGILVKGEDFCAKGMLGWTSNVSTDHDGDGCYDGSEDSDDDQDGLNDTNDACPLGKTWWDVLTDLDRDGCFSPDEDNDSDNDGIVDEFDDCPAGQTGWTSSTITDHDGDGCNDDVEDADDDNDLILDDGDACPRGETGWVSSVATDHDADGCEDVGEDGDDDNDLILDDGDACPTGVTGPWNSSVADYDDDGCVDREDDDMDNDGVLNEVDLCPLGMNGWLSDRLKDQDGDGCEDSSEDDDDDGDGTVDAKQYMLMGEGAGYTWIRIGLALAAILLVSVLIRKKKGETDLFAAPANAKVSSFFEGDASDAPHGARQTQSSTHCSTCGGDGEWFDDHNWAWCNHCEAWVP